MFVDSGSAHPSRAGRSLFTYLVAALLATAGTLLSVYVARAAPATTISLTINQREAVVNGESVTLDTAPVLDASSGRTFVPVRFIGENLGAYIDWNAAEKKVTYLTGDTVIRLWIGQNVAEVNGHTVTLDAAPYIDANSRTLVPVRFVSEQMGASVSWDGVKQVVTITAPWVGRVVVMKDHQYVPETLVVSAGTRVTWVNLDDTTHDVVGSGLASPDLEQGQAYSYTFSKAGAFPYFCSFHDGMTAAVEVH